ncbi:hypothetical protein LEMLEM_LOCUS12720 [Lemmus lemmus]
MESILSPVVHALIPTKVLVISPSLIKTNCCALRCR